MSGSNLLLPGFILDTSKVTGKLACFVTHCPIYHLHKPLDPEWERKQRLREYRVASRREKRNRKSDEKKQRKLNATILRRMVSLFFRSPMNYTVSDHSRPEIPKNTIKIRNVIACVKLKPRDEE